MLPRFTAPEQSAGCPRTAFALGMSKEVEQSDDRTGVVIEGSDCQYMFSLCYGAGAPVRRVARFGAPFSKLTSRSSIEALASFNVCIVRVCTKRGHP